ncbi:MAG: hypothetical protein LQ340_000572 [Diploschistes diacapsis]|nr:MAG: hypothetical protein LQ340_000572 [Diploschistes diacapsis]
MLANMRYGSEPPSQWTSLDQILQSGWQASTYNANFPPLYGMLNSARWYESDFARYRYDVNTVAGVVIVVTAYAPKQPYVNPSQPNNPAPCTFLSDFVFLAIQQQCGTQGLPCIQRLQYIIHMLVSNSVSVAVAQRVFTGGTGTPASFPQWPGRSYETDTEGGAALVGVPNGYGVAYMLAQHRAQLGPRTVDQVRVFGNDYGQLCIAWHVNVL